MPAETPGHQLAPPALGLQLALPEAPPDMQSYAVFDLETTGLRPAVDHVIEIGWCVVRAGWVAPVQSLLVQSPVPVPPEVQKLTGITPQLLEREAIPLRQALDRFFADCGELPLVGHNVVRFDAYFLEAACRLAGLAAPARGRYRDTAALYKAQKLALRRRPDQDHWAFACEALDRPAPGLRYALARCCSELGIALDGVERHRAAGDVTLTQQLYARLCSAP